MILPQVPIAIIGAGPAGLTLARLLELSSIDYLVFERDKSAVIADQRSNSGTLDIHQDSGQEALRAAGLLDNFRSVARYNVPVRIADKEGTVHAHIPGDDNNDKPEVDRSVLRRILLEAVPADRIRWDCAVQEVKAESDGTMSIYNHEGKVASGFRLLVGADGAWSKVRKLVTTDSPRFCGTQMFTSIIKPECPTYLSADTLADRGNYLALGDQQQIFLHYLGNGSYHLAVGVKATAPSAQDRASKGPLEVSVSALQQKFSTWAPQLRKFISSSSYPFRLWPLYSMTEDSVGWEHVSGVTLIGDAAHLTVPSGTGVNNALYDAYSLAECIMASGVDEIDSAVQKYERDMNVRALEAIGKGKWFTEHFFGAQSPVEFLKRVGADAQ